MKKFFFAAAVFLVFAIILSGCVQQPATQAPPQGNAAGEQEPAAGNGGNAPETGTVNGTGGVENGAVGEEGETQGDSGGPVEAKEVVVQMTDSGFVPQEATIKQGDTVKWVNAGTVARWPASARHPTHEVYPGSGITKCGTPEEPGIFDACTGIQAGDSYSFTFSEKGSWAYHDHLNPDVFGKIIVE